MEVRPVLATNDRAEADRACEELRAHGVKCDVFEHVPEVMDPYPNFPAREERYQVVVAVDDEDRAREIVVKQKQ